MRTGLRGILGGVILGALTIAGQAVTPDAGQQYDNIARRNVFALKPPTQPTSTNAAPPDLALPTVKLTGITTILGNKLALFKVQFPAEKGKPAKEDSLMLTEGQREDGIEVLQIDEKAGRIRVNNSGHIMPVDFDKDAMKAASGTNRPPATGGAPGAPGLPPPSFENASPAPPIRTIPRLPSRSLQVPAPAGASTAPPAAAAPTTMQTNVTAGYNPSAYQAPTAAPNTTASTTGQPLTPTGLTAEDIAALQALEAAAAQRTQAVRTVPAPMSRPPTMPLVPQ